MELGAGIDDGEGLREFGPLRQRGGDSLRAPDERPVGRACGRERDCAVFRHA